MIVEQDAVLAPADEQVQMHAQALQEQFASLEAESLALGDETVLFEIAPAVAVSAAWAIQRIVCRSRSPPGLSLQLGSRL